MGSFNINVIYTLANDRWVIVGDNDELTLSKHSSEFL